MASFSAPFVSGAGALLLNVDPTTVSMSPGTAAVNPGQSATYTVSVTPSGGFNKVVMFSCSGLPAGASCNVAPSSVTLDGTRSSTAQLVVTTTKNSALPDWPQSRIEQKLNPWSGVALLLLWIFLWFGWSKLLGVRRASLRALWPAVAAILLAVLCSSCGGGTSSIGPAPPPPGPTPAGTSAIVVTGTSGNVSHAATAQLTVN